jgi:hypothetical protein
LITEEWPCRAPVSFPVSFAALQRALSGPTGAT